MNCSLCQPADLLIYQDELVRCYHVVDMAIPGYVMIHPVRHVTRYCDLQDSEQNRMSQIITKIQTYVYDLPGVKKCYLMSLGELTPHFHMHIFPRYDWMIKDPTHPIDGAMLFSQVRHDCGRAIDKAKIHEVVAQCRGLF